MAVDVKSKDFGWRVAKILKHGYTNFEKEQDCTTTLLWLKDRGVVLKGGKEFGIHPETKDYIIVPGKRNVNKIAKILKQEFDIDRP